MLRLRQTGRRNRNKMIHFEIWKQGLILVILVVGFLLAMPNVWSSGMRSALQDYWPSEGLHLGLDLRGGSHLLLEVDVKAAHKERLEALRGEVRTTLRKEGIGYRNLRSTAAGVRLELRDNKQAQKAREVLQAITGFSGSDLLSAFTQSQGALLVEINAQGQTLITPNEEARRAQNLLALTQSIEVIRRRVDELGTTEPTIQRQGDERILVQVPGLDDPDRLKKLIGQTAKLYFKLVSRRSAEPNRAPAGTERLPMADDPSQSVLLERRAILSGDNLIDAQPAFEQFTNRPIVIFQLDTAGARKFGDITTNNVGRPFAIILDNKVISSPVINEPILGGRAQISGSFTTKEANDLAILLRAGALPAPLYILEERTVGPELGADSIRAGSWAAVIGLMAVVIFIIVVYGLFGVFANIALFVNLVLIVGVLSLLQATLTLPGIAGIVLTIGMAVDANVLIFERIREEIGNGKTPISAIDAGYRRALGTIADANITTFIAAAVLFFIGSGPVRGFAITLGIGIISSVWTAFILTRYLTYLWIKLRRPQTLPLRTITPMMLEGAK